MPSTRQIEKSYELARERFAEVDVDVDGALDKVNAISLSIHCWQGDDVGGFENVGETLGGGLAVTGNYPGKARTPDELRRDFEKALSLIPGRHRFSLHASYAETDGAKVERDQLEPRHFARWIDWARDQQLGLDFNPTFFAHPKARDGFTLAHTDDSIRRFWIEHGKRSREIGASFGKALGTPCITNLWIPDGYKDQPADRKGPRERLARSLDEVFAAPLNPAHNRDAVEGKLFGIGSESYVVGSHEFYYGYAIKNETLLCLDAGHFHPTEVLADKISAVLTWVNEILLHVSRGVRWDSDHVVTLTDELRGLAQELVRGSYLDRVHIGLDFFDASINRVAAWVIGARATIQALLGALLEPQETLRSAERRSDLTARLAIQEAAKQLPYGAAWDYYCLKNGVPTDLGWLDAVKTYEKQVLSLR